MTTDTPVPMTPQEEALIRALGRLMVVLPRAMDADLLREQGVPITEYTAMMFLSEAPERLMRMNELATCCVLSVSGITRVVARLESRGLVRRIRCDEDGRGQNAVLTDEGLARLKEAWPAHLASVRRHVLDHLGDTDPGDLAALLNRFAASRAIT